jgi:hypothetical protein
VTFRTDIGSYPAVEYEFTMVLVYEFAILLWYISTIAEHIGENHEFEVFTVMLGRAK